MVSGPDTSSKPPTASVPSPPVATSRAAASSLVAVTVSLLVPTMPGPIAALSLLPGLSCGAQSVAVAQSPLTPLAQEMVDIFAVLQPVRSGLYNSVGAAGCQGMRRQGAVGNKRVVLVIPAFAGMTM